MAEQNRTEPSQNPAHTFVWLCGIGVTAFAVPFLFSNILHWPRAIFLLPYILIIGAETLLYLRWAGFRPRDLAHHWKAGLVLALAASAFVVASLGRYPASPAPDGLELVGVLAWLGFAYGAVDALLLNIVPVVAMNSLAFATIRRPWLRASLRGTSALAISALLALIYHLGYPEFRGPSVVSPVFGNVPITATYVLSGNPLAPLLTHIAMHVGAIEHGLETVPQLPPHKTSP
ncbi:MAG TPA: hypothetical protein VN766_14520 [Stellaceae bacterium]|nr:hypothetical protein [Stellaceae bacterium]